MYFAPPHSQGQSIANVITNKKCDVLDVIKLQM